MPPEQRRLLQVGNSDQARGEAVFHIVRAVSDLVGHVRNLRLEGRRPQAPKVIRNESGPARMGEDPVPRFARQVEARKARIGAFEFVHDAEGLDVVLEPSVIPHQPVENLFPRVAEGGVPEVVRERHCFGEVFVEAERPGDRARDLRDLEGMGEPGPVVVAFVVDEDLRLVLKPAEGARMDDPVPVPLIRRPQRFGRFRPAAARRAGTAAGGGTQSPLYLHVSNL